MFFKSSTKKEKLKPDWSIAAGFVTNNKTDKMYPLNSVYCSISEDENFATLWLDNRYLITLKVGKKDLSSLRVQCESCSDFIPSLIPLGLTDSNGIKWSRIDQSMVSNDERSFSLASLRFETISATEVMALCYGKPVFQFHVSFREDLELQKDIVLRQIYGRMSGQALKYFMDNQVAKVTEVPISASEVLLTTEAISPFEIEKRFDVITAEIAFGMNIFKDVFAAFSDVFGGKNKSISNTLKDARLVVLDQLRVEARSLGANAVIAIDLDYSEISGNGKSMLFVVASGTAVRIKR